MSTLQFCKVGAKRAKIKVIGIAFMDNSSRIEGRKCRVITYITIWLNERSTMNIDDWISVKQAAELVEYREGYVRKLVREGLIISTKKGHAVLIYKPSIIEYKNKPKQIGWPKGKPRKSK